VWVRILGWSVDEVGGPEDRGWRGEGKSRRLGRGGGGRRCGTGVDGEGGMRGGGRRVGEDREGGGGKVKVRVLGGGRGPAHKWWVLEAGAVGGWRREVTGEY